MRITVDITPLRMPRSGVGTFVGSLFGAMDALSHDAHEFNGFATGASRVSLEGVERTFRRVTRWPVPTRAAYFAWRTLGWPPADGLGARAADVCHATNYVLPPVRGPSTT